MAPPVQLDQVMMALTCLLSAADINKSTISLNSPLMYTVENAPTVDCQYEFINEFIGLKEKIHEVSEQQAKEIDILENEIGEMSKYLSELGAQQNNKNDPYCEGIVNNIATINVKSLTKPLEITCESNRYGKNWMVVLNKNGKGNFSSNSNDTAYINGYKTSDGNYFMGLRTLHALSLERKHEALIVWEDKHNMEHFIYVPYVSLEKKEKDYKIILNDAKFPTKKDLTKAASAEIIGIAMKIFTRSIPDSDN